MKQIYTLDEYVSAKRSEATRRRTWQRLRQFLLFIYPDATVETLEDAARHFLTERSDRFTCILQFVREYSGKLAPMTLNHTVSEIQYWLKWNSRELSVQERAVLKNTLPRCVVITEDEVLTVPMIRQILDHSDVMMRAFVLTLASSGMRAEELLSVRFSDMRQSKCRYFHIPADRMKAGKPHDYRYSDEAHAAIEEWLKVRESAIESADCKTVKCLKNESSIDEGEIFPMTYSAHRQKFSRVLRDAGLLRTSGASGRSTISFQSFRRWFDSVLKLHLSINMANEIVGHDEGLSTNYRRYPREMVDDAYLSVIDHLRIYAPDDYVALKGSMSDELKTQASTTAALAAELLRQREEIDAMKLFIQATKKE